MNDSKAYNNDKFNSRLIIGMVDIFSLPNNMGLFSIKGVS